MIDKSTKIDYFRSQLVAAYLAREPSSPTPSRRASPRVKLEIPLTLHMDEWETDTQTLDLSEGGYSFLSSHPPTQEFIPFALELAPQRVVRGHARIVAQIPSGTRFRVCVQFSRLRPEVRAAIAERVFDSIETTLAAAPVAYAI